ncbi:MAG: NAD(P)/FAD-dependent oxidoreductase [Syntrophobacteraceae bacterium]
MDVIVIGAGASGLMCAMEAGKRGRRVLVLEHTEKICGKVRISGGGHCNFTNRNVSPANFLSHNPHFSTSALSRFGPDEFISMLERRQIKYHERDCGQLFCRGSSNEVIDMLKNECYSAGVEFLLDCKISEIRKEARFSILTNLGEFDSESLVIATGGLCAPDIGATNFGYATAKKFGLKVTALRPALTPLKLGREDRKLFGVLSGISIDAGVSFNQKGFRGNVLFTHKGLSGPAILQISSYWDGDGGIAIDLFPEMDIHRILMDKRNSAMLLSTLLDRYLPGRFVRIWCELHSGTRPLNQYSTKELDALGRTLHDWRLVPAGTEGFNKAEVTLGGVDTSELSSKTMESKKVPGLFFIGEVIDVTGHLGGYNLHWAWASGFAAGQFV